MNRFLRCLTYLPVVFVVACGAKAPPPVAEAPTTTAGQPSPRLTDADVAAAVRVALGGDWDARYFDVTIDLNGDGQLEAVAYVAGPMICGTGGCPVYVFTPGPDGYRLVSQVSVARPPVRVGPDSTHGWRDLIVGIGGGGLPPGNALLKFDGSSYPSNPTVPPAEPAPGLDDTVVLIPELQSYTDGRPLPGVAAQ